MVVYKTAQLGTTWAVFRIEGTRFSRVAGPFRTRLAAQSRQRLLEERELRRSSAASEPEAAYDGERRRPKGSH